MKRAQAKIVSALLLSMDIGSYDIHDVVGAKDLFHLFIRIIHILISRQITSQFLGM